MQLIQPLNFAIAFLFFICYAYQFYYILVAFCRRDKPHGPVKLHRYAVLISARNEAAVIGQLLDSIRSQDYPRAMVRIFVVADNCTDDTAQVARRHGAFVYERFHQTQVGKGYALNYLLREIAQDYPPDAFDGYFVFDADNILSENYITEMNKSFSDGYAILTSYRNSKNYGDNWISAGYALWFLRESRFLNHSRMLLGTSCAVSGTGFLFSRQILEQCGGWNFFLLTEDIQFTVHNVVAGEKIGYCSTAVVYDEQPVTLRQSWRQRMRWAKGYLQVFRMYGTRLLKGIVTKRSFSCFDMTMNIMPAMILTALSILLNVGAAVYGLLAGENLLIGLRSVLETVCNTYFCLLLIGGITTLNQWKAIHTTTAKKILYTFTFPVFMLLYIPISICALFRKVEWSPIQHNKALTLQEIRGQGPSL